MGMTILFAAAVALGQPPAGQSSSVDQFQLQLEKVPTNSVYHYVKSNRDGTHETRFSVRVASQRELAVLKHNPGAEFTSYVTAVMDWSIFCAARLDSWQIDRSGNRHHRGTLRYDPRQSVIRLEMGGGQLPPIPVRHIPFHLWDFDFTSLGVTFAHLKDPESGFVIGVADPTYAEDGPPFLYKGEVEVRYEGDETRNRVACRKYRVDGPGLEQRGGFIWVSTTEGNVVEMEIALPDEPGFDDVRIRLERIETMSPEAWDQYVLESCRR